MANTPLFDLTLQARWRMVTIIEKMTMEAREATVELIQQAHDLGYAEGFAKGFAEGGRAEQARIVSQSPTSSLTIDDLRLTDEMERRADD